MRMYFLWPFVIRLARLVSAGSEVSGLVSEPRGGARQRRARQLGVECGRRGRDERLGGNGRLRSDHGQFRGCFRWRAWSWGAP